MAIYHCSVKNISRSGGKSAVASASYRAGEKLEDRETGLTHDYTNKSEVAYLKYSFARMHRVSTKTEKPYGTQ